MTASNTARPPSEGGPSAFPPPSVTVPAGRVLLTDRRSQRSWQVDVDAFELSAVPVTQALFAQVTGARPSATHSDNRPVEGVSWWDAIRFCNELSRLTGRTPAYRLPPTPQPNVPSLSGLASSPDLASPLGSASPLGLVSATDSGPPPGPGSLAGSGSLPFPDFLAGSDPADLAALPADVLHEAAGAIEWDRAADGYRLPTEAEWEHACRAGTTGPRYGELNEIAWHRGNSDGHPHDVGGKLPNAWGLHDMLGNVWDWCWDVYDAAVYGSYRVLRGGGWFDEHWSCRASVRRRSHPTFRVDDVGFRVARSTSN
jgi:sulfatase modifying factor 1